MVIKTVELEKNNKNRWYDIIKNKQGYAIQRNGRTLTGRLSGYGASQIFEDYLQSDKEHGWIEIDKTETHEFYVSVTSG